VHVLPGKSTFAKMATKIFDNQVFNDELQHYAHDIKSNIIECVSELANYAQTSVLVAMNEREEVRVRCFVEFFLEKNSISLILIMNSSKLFLSISLETPNAHAQVHYQGIRILRHESSSCS